MTSENAKTASAPATPRPQPRRARRRRRARVPAPARRPAQGSRRSPRASPAARSRRRRSPRRRARPRSASSRRRRRREARPVAGEHDRARAPDVDERLRQLGDQRRVEGVAPVGTRERDRAARRPSRSIAQVRRHAGESLESRPCCAERSPPPSRRSATAAPLDADAVPAVRRLPCGRGLDGVLALGTTGEGILLSRGRAARAAAALPRGGRGRLQVAVHCGAQTTADTAALAEHAADPAPTRRRDRPAVLRARRGGAARALRGCGGGLRAAALLPLRVRGAQRLRGSACPCSSGCASAAPNLAGLKVSDPPWESVEPYLLEGLDVFVGAEALIARGLERGAAGAVSGLAASFPDAVVPLVREPSASAASGRTAARRAHRLPFHAASKTVARLRGRARRGRTCARRCGGLTADERGRAVARVARIVVAGSGAIGASVAYNLALLGARDVVVAERGALGGGSTSRAMGGVRQQFSTAAEVVLAHESIALPRGARAALLPTRSATSSSRRPSKGLAELEERRDATDRARRAGRAGRPLLRRGTAHGRRARRDVSARRTASPTRRARARAAAAGRASSVSRCAKERTPRERRGDDVLVIACGPWSAELASTRRSRAAGPAALPPAARDRPRSKSCPTACRW